MTEFPGQPKGISHHSGKVTVGFQFKDLGADVGMQTLDPGPGGTLQSAKHRLELIGIETEFAVEMSSADVLVGVTLDSRRKAEHEPHWLATLRNDGLQQIKVVLVISDHHHAAAIGQCQLLQGFVVAMQHHALCRHASVEGGDQFTG